MSLARVLIVAGSDSGGGAGIQGDIKTVTCLGGYAATAITALTAQNTIGVRGVYPVPPDFVSSQMRCVLDDIGADAIKTGMLHDASIISAVADALSGCAAPLILDPVMIAKGGAALLKEEAAAALKSRLLPAARLITPNIPEAEALTARTIKNTDDMRGAAEQLLAMGAQAVLLKGGHLDADPIPDMLLDASGMEIFMQPRIATRHTHGTGCTLASAIATGLAQGLTLRDAVLRARQYVYTAIQEAPELGSGHGPLGHNYNIKALHAL